MSTITAISTPHGTGGIAVVRLSGPQAFEIADRAWKGAPLAEAATHTAHLGTITDADGSALDQAVATVFRAPRSFTGEDTVEFSVHGSKWIQRKVVERLIALGARAAEPGEFSRRAFLNGRLDLAQAEGVADLIAASSRAAHRLAMSQVSGTFSSRLNSLRDSLVELASLLELELDFSEEEVEFADRARLRDITHQTLAMTERLASTYAAGRAFKEGVPVVIAGAPNAGKSTLLNRLLGEDKAIVSDIPGTTRDVIEDTREIGGVLFRFFDTAGLRDTSETVERIGIERARDIIGRAAIVLWLIDASDADLAQRLEETEVQIDAHPQARHIILFTKADKTAGGMPDDAAEMRSKRASMPGETDGIEAGSLRISAKEDLNIDTLEAALVAAAKSEHDPDAELIVTNARHHAALLVGAESLRRVDEGLSSGLPADLIAQDVRESLHHLGLLTGAVTTDTLLGTIFSRFCIGK
jgi:tRNA modification GTPase